MKWKRICAGLVAGLVAASAFVLPVEPVPVHADAGEFSGAIDYFISLSGDDAAAFAASDGGVVAGVILGLYLCTRNPISTGSTVDASTISYSIGTYSNGTDLKCGTMVCPSGAFTGQDGFTFGFSDDYELVFTASGASTGFRGETHTGSGWKYFNYVFTPTYSGSDRLNVIISNRKSQSGILTGSYNCTWGSSFMGCAFNIADSSPNLTGSTLASVCTGDFNGSSGRGRFLGNSRYGQFPSGEFDLSNPTTYIENTVRPWVEENYPDYTFLLPDAPPPEPEYPTDFVTGIPKDWTITNPQLPSIPDLDFQIPTADFDSLDVSPIRQNLSGVGFWWDLLETVLDTTAFKGLFIAFAIIGLAIFVLWKLGA